MPKAGKVAITKRALLQRINRALRKDDEQVKTTRGDRLRHELGDFYRIDFNRNVVIGKHVDLEELGRDLKVLQPWEVLESED